MNLLDVHYKHEVRCPRCAGRDFLMPAHPKPLDSVVCAHCERPFQYAELVAPLSFFERARRVLLHRL